MTNKEEKEEEEEEEKEGVYSNAIREKEVRKRSRRQNLTCNKLEKCCQFLRESFQLYATDVPVAQTMQELVLQL